MELVWNKYSAHNGSTVTPKTTTSTLSAGKTDTPFCGHLTRLWRSVQVLKIMLAIRAENNAPIDFESG